MTNLESFEIPFPMSHMMKWSCLSNWMGMMQNVDSTKKWIILLKVLLLLISHFASIFRRISTPYSYPWSIVPVPTSDGQKDQDWSSPWRHHWLNHFFCSFSARVSLFQSSRDLWSSPWHPSCSAFCSFFDSCMKVFSRRGDPLMCNCRRLRMAIWFRMAETSAYSWTDSPLSLQAERAFDRTDAEWIAPMSVSGIE
jgi:hypothetical protein